MYQPLTAGDLCTRETVVVSRTTTPTVAARLMRERDVGSLVIVDERPAGRVPVGVVIERDLVTAVLAPHVDVHALRVETQLQAVAAALACSRPREERGRP